jgi:hypothetical protein
MHSEIANEISVLIDNLQLFTRVVVVYANLCVISANYDPLLSGDKLRASDRRIGDFERSHLRLLIVVKYDDCACIKADEHPGQSGMQLHTLDTL